MANRSLTAGEAAPRAEPSTQKKAAKLAAFFVKDSV